MNILRSQRLIQARNLRMTTISVVENLVFEAMAADTNRG